MESKNFRFYTITFGFILLFIEPSHPFGAGPPDDACENMKPNHGPAPQDIANIPAELTFSPPGPIKAGKKVTLTLKVKENGKNFKGYIIQARKGDDVKALGTFETEVGKLLKCGEGFAVTHKESSVKTEVTAKWIAPQDLDGEVYFKYSVVVTKPVFYVGAKTAKNLKVTGGKPADGGNKESSAPSSSAPLSILAVFATSLICFAN